MKKQKKIKKTKHLIIGKGEVGSSLFLAMKDFYQVFIRDKDDEIKEKFDVVHICYPFSKNFIKITKDYLRKYKPSLVIIHSTVPVGTTTKISSIAVHSPIRGLHPNLEKGIKTFVKYFGGKKSKEAEKYFSNINIETHSFSKAETTELLKIFDTTYYGWNIIFAKELKNICDKLKLDFNEVYTIANADYNEGYTKLGKSNVVRPVLKAVDGKIGGHCIVPNCDLFDCWITKTIKERNKKY